MSQVLPATITGKGNTHADSVSKCLYGNSLRQFTWALNGSDLGWIEPHRNDSIQDNLSDGVERTMLKAHTLLLITSALLGVIGVGCGRPQPACARCDTIVIAAISEPQALLPPLIWESVGRDIADLVYQRLAVLDGGRSPTDLAGYQPMLATRWERLDSLRWRFVLEAAARWHDGTPVTAADVAFSFAAYQDSVLDAPARRSLEGLSVGVESDSSVVFSFARAYPEQIYDATWHVRIIPRHLWEPLPRDRWSSDTAIARLVGSGPYRVSRWDRGQSLTLERVPEARAVARQVVWRFAASAEAAANLVLSHEADVLETVPDPARRGEFVADTTLALFSYPSAVYGYLGFQLAGSGALSDRRVRQALGLALDRTQLVEAVLGPGTAVPAGPMSRMLWLWDDREPAPMDTNAAGALLDEAGWRLMANGQRGRSGKPLLVDILVPATSLTRRALAVAIQQRWSRLGVRASVTAIDFPVFQERLGKGKFETYIGAWLDEPSPRSLAEQWTRAGWGAQNYGKYGNPVFDALFGKVMAAATPQQARDLWRQAIDTLAADQPAVFLYTLTNTAVASKRIESFRVDAYGWAKYVPDWKPVRD
jgi:peptide/nickel transport system substrate-binding protein